MKWSIDASENQPAIIKFNNNSINSFGVESKIIWLQTLIQGLLFRYSYAKILKSKLRTEISLGLSIEKRYNLVKKSNNFNVDNLGNQTNLVKIAFTNCITDL